MSDKKEYKEGQRDALKRVQKMYVEGKDSYFIQKFIQEYLKGL